MSFPASGKAIYVTFVFALIAGCAKISAPTGGPKDLIPPVVVGSLPENGARNFAGNRISIDFNEYVTLDKINEKLMISPPFEKRPEVMIRGKSVLIQYDEKLHDSTTYTFYFGDAIRDLNEGNILDNYQFVFSSGPVIDSLSVTGNILSSYTLEPPENTIIMLYRNLSDTAVVKTIPDYITKSDKNGYFRINNIRPGSYRLYGLKDIDNSKNFNVPDEEFAFLDSAIVVSAERNYLPVVKDTSSVPAAQKVQAEIPKQEGEYRLFLYKPEKKLRYLSSSERKTQYQLQYTLSRPAGSMKFDVSIAGATDDMFIKERSRENDTLTIWLADSTLFLQQQLLTLVDYPFTDSTGAEFQKTDTVLMRYLAPRVSARTRLKPVPYRLKFGTSSGSLRPGEMIPILSETPLLARDTSKIRLWELDGAARKKLEYNILKDSSNSCRLVLSAKFVQGKNYLFSAEPMAFISIYGERSDSSGFKFSVRNNDSFGSLVLNINNFEGPKIIQLLGDQEKVVRQLTPGDTKKAEFRMLDRGRYRLRIVYDLNKDGKWTTGDFSSGRQPEPVSYLPKEIEIRENFDIEEDWDVSEKNNKNLIKAPEKAPGVR